jgi:signal peptidase II
VLTVTEKAAGPQARRMAVARVLATGSTVVALDQVVKHTVATSIGPDQVIHIVPGLQLVHVRNTGVAFGFLSGNGAAVYIATAVAVVALLAYLFARPRKWLLWLPTGMLIGGAAGNLIDRINRGSVIDFIKLPHWPAFNLADVSITFGVIVLLFVIELGGRRDGGT